MTRSPWVLTLVGASPDEHLLTDGAALLAAAGGQLGDRRWLAPDLACDIEFEHPSPSDLMPSLHEALGQARRVDLHTQPVAGRRKRLLMADMESTVIREEMLDELALVAGCGERVADITARAMNGELDFEQALAERLALLAGLPVSVLEDCAEQMTIDPGASVLVATMRVHGAHTALVTGGFDFFAEKVCARVPFDSLRANRLVLRNESVAGEVAQPVLDKSAKLSALEELCATLGLSAEEVVAVGDGANDLPMLQAAGLGVAYHGKPRVAAAAAGRIYFGDLSVLLYYQGYSQDQFASIPQNNRA